MLQPSATYISLIIWRTDDCLYAFIRLFYMSHRSFWDTCNIWEVRSSGLLSSGHFLSTFRVYLSARTLTDVSGQPNRSQRTHGTDRLSRNIGTKLSLLAGNNPEERSSKLLRGGGLNHASVIPLNWVFSSVCVLLFYSCFECLYRRA